MGIMSWLGLAGPTLPDSGRSKGRQIPRRQLELSLEEMQALVNQSHQRPVTRLPTDLSLQERITQQGPVKLSGAQQVFGMAVKLEGPGGVQLLSKGGGIGHRGCGPGPREVAVGRAQPRARRQKHGC